MLGALYRVSLGETGRLMPFCWDLHGGDRSCGDSAAGKVVTTWLGRISLRRSRGGAAAVGEFSGGGGAGGAEVSATLL